ncbi:DUF461 domain-containing protein [Streptomyces sp. HUAS TT20]|uniref:DUF461 domain-containing protein n=1 Tax=Streptomyces sp. HUAS TT20 TaxID=3447509 RepID=UPI0021D86380|nr:DUF461 domain-containing protein [Streptomyces sp. HUAS 15-9]UXY28375.1 DUF461 domain-containing protein [Streptomyces sp. HUAS 15-9]
MSSSLRRGALAASAIAFSIASLAACAAGNDSQTLQVKPDNAATSVGTIKVQNATVITQPDLQSTGPAVVSATIFNTGTTPQTLQSLVLPGTGKTAQLSPAKGGSLTIPAGGRLILGGKNNASAVLASSRESVQDGNAQKITFTFSKTGDVSLRAFVVPATHYFTDWGPSEIPTSSATPTAAAGASASTSAKPGKHSGATATATESATGSTPSDSASASATPSGH